MKRSFLLMTAIWLCFFAEAKEWTIETASLNNIAFNIPDDYTCTYGNDTTHTDLRYVFKKGDGTEIVFYMIEIENFNKEEAEGLPDTMLLPSLRQMNILSRELPSDGRVDRIITFKEDNGDMIRQYVCFFSCGIVLMSAYSPSNDFTETDQISNSIDNHFKWKALLLIIIGFIIAMIPAFVIANAWECWENNRHKSCRYALLGISLVLIISIVGSLWLDFNFWIFFASYLFVTLCLGYMFGSGSTIIVF